MRSGMFKTIIVVSFLLISMFAGLMGFDDVMVRKGSAASLYVYPGGDLSGNYSSIQYAIDNASAGDTIYVWAGTYTENVIVNKTVTLIGNGTYNTTIQAAVSTDHAVLISADYVNISSFTITGASSAGKSGIQVSNVYHLKLENINASNNNRGIFAITVSDSWIANCTANSNSFGIYLITSCLNNTLINNTAMSNGMGIGVESNSHNNTMVNNYVSGNSNYGYIMGTSDDMKIINNTAYSNPNYGFYIYSITNSKFIDNNGTSNDDGFYVQSSSNNVFTNNTAMSNTYGFYFVGSSDDNTVENCKITGPGQNTGIRLTSSDGNTIANNTIESNGNGLYIQTSNNNIIYNNSFNNSNNVFFSSGTNYWNISKQPGPSIIGSPNLGGNFWARSDGTGFSQLNPDLDGDGLIETANTIAAGNVDYLALALGRVHNIDTDERWYHLQEGIDDSDTLDGHTIMVGEGTYNENVIVNKTLTLIAKKDNNTIIDGQGLGSVVYITTDWVNVSGFTVKNSASSFGYGGIHLYYANNCTIENNNASNNGYGIGLYNSSSNTIANNTASNNGYGIGLSSSSGNTIANNTMVKDGIIIRGTQLSHWNTHNIDIYNNVNGNPVYYWKNWTNGTVPAGAGQVILANCKNIVIENQNVSDGTVGISLGFSTSNTIANNTASSNNEYGIYLYASDGNTITNNTASSNNYYGYGYGIYFFHSSSNTIANSTALNSVIGILLDYSSTNNTIANNNASNNIFGVSLYHYSSSNTIANNTASNNAYGIYLRESSSNTIANNTASNNSYGIYLWESSSNTIANITVSSNNNYGIYLDSSSSNTIANNIASNNYYGVSLSSSSNNNITGNTVLNNSDATGIMLGFSSNNNITDNNASNNWVGIYLDSSSSNTIANNTVSSNNWAGIYLDSSSSNTIYHNNFINNTNQSYDDGVNTWNATYPTGGNYWSDYVGADNFSGPAQNISGMDGIGDTNYTGIAGGAGNADEYPLIYQLTWWYDADPNIVLLSPTINTFITPGELIKFEIWDSNYDIKNVSWSRNGFVYNSFTENYVINSSTWTSNTNIWVRVEDTDGNFHYKIFGFLIDITAPSIWNFSPGNNSAIQTGRVLSFWISDPNLDTVTYSVNGGPVIPFNSPYNISTGTWTAEGNSYVDITAKDTRGNSITRRFNFTVDNTAPAINLVSPQNNSVIMPGTPIDLDILDDNLFSVNYTWGFIIRQPLLTPFNLSTHDFVDGVHTVDIMALDTAGNLARKTFWFTFDSLPPMIMLNSPAENSIIKQGTMIDLSITDLHLDFVNFTVNGGTNQTLALAYDIDTTGWSDGVYIIEIFAHDLAGHMNSTSYSFEVDSTPPDVSVTSPAFGILTKSGVNIKISVTDKNLLGAGYSINDLVTEDLEAPYVISTTGWSDFDYFLDIWAFDVAGNNNSVTFNISLDSTRPLIELNTPDDESEITPGTTIDLGVTDVHLVSANYTVNGAAAKDLTAPYDIDTTDWADGDYTITVSAVDSVGNTASEAFTFTVKKFVVILIPEVLSISPGEGTIDMPVDTNVTLTFSLEMNRSPIQSSLAISPSAEVSSYDWNDNGTELTLTFSPDLKYSTTYNITLPAGVMAIGGGQLAEQFTSWFKTKLDTDDDGLPDDVDTDDDNDGLPDTWEFDYALNRLDPTDAAKDDDSDELSNLEEYQSGTNPKEADSDSDGLSDGAEVKIYQTAPLEADSDSDGYKDGEEVDKGTDPLDPLSMPIEDVEPEEEEDDTGLFGLSPAADYAIILVIIIIIIVVLLMVMKMRKTEEEPLEEEGEEGGEEESEEEGFECPECGAEVAAGEGICPECGVELEEPAEEEGEDEGESESAPEEESEDEDESERVGEEESGEDLEDEGESEGVGEEESSEDLEEESEMEGEEEVEEEPTEDESEEEGEVGLQCPECGAEVLSEDTACLDCGTKFD